MALTQVTTDGIANAAITQEKISSSVSLGGGGTTAYSTIAALPLSNNTSGSMAFVAENNKLYIWNGTGWFNIALLNTSPTITAGPNASYEFDVSGTPVVITLAAQDPEGIPVTWSYQVTSGTLGNTATITQNSNVFTITPSTSSADAGTFGITFTASDGVNLATATSSFELTFGPSTIGQAFDGGFYAGQISTTGDGVATHYLIVGPRSSTEFTGSWKTSQTTTASTTSVIDGPANTAAMIAAGAANHPCGQFCDNLVVGGFSDWYMPAKNELEVCYYNLKPSTLGNSNVTGNLNAVPARTSGYISGTPAQTSATAFRTGEAEAFISNNYWSSTESSASQAIAQYFGSGNMQNLNKTYTGLRVRAVRRVAVPPPPPPPPPTTIGETYAGGFYAGQISTTGDGVATHYLVVGPLSSGQFGPAQWKTSETATAGTTSVIDGPANTAAMIAAGAAAHPCGQFCDNLVAGGFSDWYMPASNELDVCYYNLKPNTNVNSTSSGINPNAVPARANAYTESTPAQTSLSAFQIGGAEAFVAFSGYWSSTESSTSIAKMQYFPNGNQYGNGFSKTKNYRVRAVRRVAV